MPNAAPVLCTRVRSRKPGMTSTLSCSAIAGANHRLGGLVEGDHDDGDDDLEPARGQHLRHLCHLRP